MFEKFPIKKPGDTLSAREVNALGDGVRISLNEKPGPNLSGFSGWFKTMAADPSHIELLVQVALEYTDDDVDIYKGLYSCEPRYFDNSTQLWATDDTTTLEVDVRGFAPSTFVKTESLFLLAKDVLNVRYDSQLGLFVPIDPPVERFGMLDGILSYGGTAVVSVYDGTVDTGRTVTVYDWLLSSGQTIAAGTKVFIKYFHNGKYHVTGAQCS